MLNKYFALSEKMDKMVEGGMNEYNPVVRSMARKLWKMYKSATKEEQVIIDGYHHLYFK